MNKNIFGPHKSSIGDLDANVAALIPYLAIMVLGFVPLIGTFSWVIPVVFFFMEKNSAFVRFNAMQVILLQVIGLIIGMIFRIVIGFVIALGFMSSMTYYDGLGFSTGLVGVGMIGIITIIIHIIIFIFSLIAAFSTYKYEIYKIPVVGDMAAKFVNLNV